MPAPRTSTRCLAPATHGPRCAQHAEPEHRPPASQRGYGSAWRRRRRQYLDAHPLCAIGGIGCTTTATIPDHWPILRNDLIARGEPHPDADHHLRPACASCHAKYGLRTRTEA